VSEPEGTKLPLFRAKPIEVPARRSLFPFRFFELEEVNAPTAVAGYYFVITNEHTGASQVNVVNTPSPCRR
jgi:hypothetical protein